MRIVLVLLIALHGIIHLAGYMKAFQFRAFPELTMPISRPMGLAWLGAALLLMAYALSTLAGYRMAWVIGTGAVVLSQTLVILYWVDARWGTLPNILLLLVVLFAFGSWQFRRMAEKETDQLLAAPALTDPPPRDIREPNTLPQPVAAWLQASGALDREPVRIGRVTQKARMKLKPEQQTWKEAHATQYTRLDAPGFIWTVKMDMLPMIRILGRDKYLDGQGEMRITLFGLFPIVQARGPKLDEGTLQRYLGELVWFPSLALSPLIRWEALDAHSARATMRYRGVEGSGTFHFNENSDFARFEALRYRGDDAKAERQPWILTVKDYATFEGVRVPSRMEATWRLPEGDWTWLVLEISELTYNERALDQRSRGSSSR
jgi:hypothetical protein